MKIYGVGTLNREISASCLGNSKSNRTSISRWADLGHLRHKLTSMKWFKRPNFHLVFLCQDSVKGKCGTGPNLKIEEIYGVF